VKGGTILVTGGAGFIGANFVNLMRRENEARIINLDKLTYAGSLASLAGLAEDPGHVFVRGDIADTELVKSLLREHRPRGIVHIAAESHVDRSIHGPAPFIETNIVGTFVLLQEVLGYWETLTGSERDEFRFLQVSTDEVYGSLMPNDPPFSETHRYEPNSPYAASKASADLLVRAYHHTYGLPVVTSNCSNNYGPYQYPEKLIPLMIHNALAGQPLPVYGDGMQVRDWLYVEDHCEALRLILARGKPGETYNIGGGAEHPNLEVVRLICSNLTEFKAGGSVAPFDRLIKFVADRPGHDRRYAMDAAKITRELGWTPKESFHSGLTKTVSWYLDHAEWVAGMKARGYSSWIAENYGHRMEKHA
jgi:dTDP-glucose 4,6-dehydratase